MIVISVDDDLQIVRVESAIASYEARRHPRRTVRVVQFGADVQRIVVEKESDLGALRWRFAFVGILLREVRDWCRGSPRGLIELRVQHHGTRATRSDRHRGRYGMAIRRGGRGGGCGVLRRQSRRSTERDDEGLRQ